MAIQIQNRRDSAADWTSADPTLAEGEIGIETDTGKMKIGDGVTAWTALDYIDSAVSHDSLTDISADDHHAQSHTIVSHSDTTATGTELNTLTDNSIANTLHRHSELVASDGSPDPALSVDSAGEVGIGTTSPLHLLGLEGESTTLLNLHRPSATLASDVVGIGFSMRNDGNAPTDDTRAGVFYKYAGDIFLAGHTGDIESDPEAYAKLYIDGPTGNVGIGVTDPHSKLEVNGAISSGQSTFSTTGPTDNVDVSGVNSLLVDCSSNAVTIGGFAGGVAGQILHIVMIDNTNHLTLEHEEGGGSQDLHMHQEVNEEIDAGGVTMVCDGSDWWDCSHAKHV